LPRSHPSTPTRLRFFYLTDVRHYRHCIGPAGPPVRALSLAHQPPCWLRVRAIQQLFLGLFRRSDMAQYRAMYMLTLVGFKVDERFLLHCCAAAPWPDFTRRLNCGQRLLELGAQIGIFFLWLALISFQTNDSTSFEAFYSFVALALFAESRLLNGSTAGGAYIQPHKWVQLSAFIDLFPSIRSDSCHSRSGTSNTFYSSGDGATPSLEAFYCLVAFRFNLIISTWFKGETTLVYTGIQESRNHSRLLRALILQYASFVQILNSAERSPALRTNLTSDSIPRVKASLGGIDSVHNPYNHK
ncbi:hypothetical protein B0H15DRAFT_997632, partial [Mycena belliarum]